MARNIVKAKLDIIFKKLFTDEGNQHLLQAYLSDTLGIPYDSIENLVVLNSEIMPDSITEKYSRMDIRMKANGRLINVEMQIKDEGDYKDRSLYYLSKLYSGQLIEYLCQFYEFNESQGFSTCIDYCLASEYCQWAKEHWGIDISNDTACQDLTAYVFFPCMG